MATLTWVSGSTKNWSDSTAWSPAQVPTAADDIVFPGSSTGTLTINGTSGAPDLCRSVDFTGFGGTLLQATTKQLNVGDGTTGHFKLVSGMTYIPSATSLIKFISTTTGNNITTAAKRVGSFTFDGVGGEWTFQDACNSVSGSTITLTNGSLITNNQTVGATSGVIFSSNNSNTRSLTLGTTTWTIPTTTGVTVWNIGTSTGMTLSAASSTINMGDPFTGVVFAGGGLTYGTFTTTSMTVAANFTITGANTFGTLTLSVSGSSLNARTDGYFLAANQTVTGTFTSNGTAANKRVFIGSNAPGTQRTISAATVSCTYIDLRDILGSGAGSWNLSGVTGGSGNCGGNSGITFNTAKNCYMKTAVSVNFSASNWYTTSGGSTLISPTTPLPQDTCFFDANSITAGSVTVTYDYARVPALDCTGVTNTPTWTRGRDLEFYGSLKLVSGMSILGSSFNTYFYNRSPATLDTGGLTWASTSLSPGIIFCECFGTTLTQASNFTSNSYIYSQVGTFDTSTYNHTAGALILGGGSFIQGSGTVTFGGGTYTGPGGGGGETSHVFIG